MSDTSERAIVQRDGEILKQAGRLEKLLVTIHDWMSLLEEVLGPVRRSMPELPDNPDKVLRSLAGSSLASQMAGLASELERLDMRLIGLRDSLDL